MYQSKFSEKIQLGLSSRTKISYQIKQIEVTMPFFYIIILLLVLHFYSHIEYEIFGIKDYYIVPLKILNVSLMLR